MGKRVRLRLLATNDLLGSFHPWPTAYGFLPGGNAIRATVDRFRSQGPALWADAGDFAQGGVIATRTNGLGGFIAMDSLEPDVAVAGNHEFDWGTPTARAGARRLRAPLLCANYPGSGLAATAVFQVAGVSVGVVGCTTPDLFRLVREPAADLVDVAVTIQRASRCLHSDGCDMVFAIVHDGVDWKPRRGGVRVLPRRFAGAIAPWASSVDAIVAGHTLGRWIGTVCGTPVVQPWAFGQEVGVVEFDDELRPTRVYGVTPGPSSPWDGFGADLIKAATNEVIGVLPRPMRNQPGVDSSLPRYVAAAMARQHGSDAGIFGCWEMATGQPPIDGTLAYLGAGDVSEADVLRLVPYLDDSIVEVLLSREELDRLRQRTDLAVWTRDDTGEGPLRVAVTRYSSANLPVEIGRDPIVEPVPTGVRESLRSALHQMGRRV